MKCKPSFSVNSEYGIKPTLGDVYCLLRGFIEAILILQDDKIQTPGLKKPVKIRAIPK